MSRPKLLIIGSIPHPEVGKTYGGTTILMQSFLDYCKTNGINYHFIQANKYLRNLASIRNFIYVIGLLLFKIRSSDIVMLNVASRGAFYLSPIVYIVSRVCRKKIVFRKFGGNFHQLFQISPKWKQNLLKKTIFNADLLFFETLAMVNYFKEIIKNKESVSWFPNVRSNPNITINSQIYKFRFVFISHIKKTKGVLEIIQASKNLPDNYIIDLYGPIMDKSVTMESFSGSNANYKGVLKQDEVTSTLANYDVLLLPTFHPGEGYPGIIIESFSLGIPVISTNWNAVPEIIHDKINGLIIPPQNANALTNAILSITPDNYLELSLNAKQSFEGFHDIIIYKKVIDKLNHLCKNR